MDGPAHLLSLKVMRVSRPELASAWQPFYSSSPSFSAHSTASIVSLQGASPLTGHPKTLRDLTHVSELLTLPSAFGSIQLGETFSSCLCINNEAQADVEGVSMRVEMQTATTKVVLAEFGGPEHVLAAGGTLESIVNHEIKELGQHVLACSVTYRSPQHPQQLDSTSPDADGSQTFRKFYKFAVTNPLSVKTKVHTPRSPSALMSPIERDKVFLEVHIQNLTQDPMFFERMEFECVDGWDVNDINLPNDDTGSVNQGLQPQDVRQYIYILSPKTISLAPVVYDPGSIVPLGRLDIFWRSTFGEPGRLLTSMLSRRIPLPPAPIPQPVSALPSYLKRLSRPQSPQPNQSRPGTPPPMQRPGSPSQNRPSSFGPVRIQSPFQIPPPIPIPEIEVALIVRSGPRSTIKMEEPFNMSFSLILSMTSPLPGRGHRRVARLAVQHLQPPPIATLPFAIPPAHPETFSPRLPSSGFSTPSSTTPTFNYALAHQKLLLASPRQHHSLDGLERDHEERKINDTITLPPPFFDGPEKPTSSGVRFLGSSILFLPTVELPPITTEPQEQSTELISKPSVVQDFELSYIPIQTGYIRIGGLRVLLVEDKIIDEHENVTDLVSDEKLDKPNHARSLKEWEVVGETWVS